MKKFVYHVKDEKIGWICLSMKEFDYEKICKWKMEGELLEIEPNTQW